MGCNASKEANGEFPGEVSRRSSSPMPQEADERTEAQLQALRLDNARLSVQVKVLHAALAAAEARADAAEQRLADRKAKKMKKVKRKKSCASAGEADAAPAAEAVLPSFPAAVTAPDAALPGSFGRVPTTDFAPGREPDLLGFDDIPVVDSVENSSRDASAVRAISPSVYHPLTPPR